MTLKKLFGKKIKSIREGLGLTQQEFAELVNMQPNSIGQIEIGYKAVSFSKLENFSSKLNLSYQEFFDFEPDYQPKNMLLGSIINEIQSLDTETQRFVLTTIRGLVKLLKKNK
jgi:transcriptional regulator with XRE-family HTH domain